MIEAVIRTYLADVLSPVPVLMETPERVPESYILIERTGGARENLLWSSTFAVQSVSSASLYDAAALSERVTAALLEADIPEISAIRLNSIYNFTNTSAAYQKTKEYRYQAVFQIYHY